MKTLFALLHTKGSPRIFIQFRAWYFFFPPYEILTQTHFPDVIDHTSLVEHLAKRQNISGR